MIEIRNRHVTICIYMYDSKIPFNVQYVDEKFVGSKMCLTELILKLIPRQRKNPFCIELLITLILYYT